MEKELLSQMIHDRDRRIAFIKKQMERQDQKMSEYQVELVEIIKQNHESEISQMEELTRLMQGREASDQMLRCLKEDLRKQQGDSLQLYNEEVKKSSMKAPGSKDSSYVIRMQAQTCKCMHYVGIMEKQTELVKVICDEAVKSLREAGNRTLDEKTNVELQLMNELVKTGNTRREMEEKSIFTLSKLGKEIKLSEDTLMDHDTDHDSDCEIDEEEKEEKQELKTELKKQNEKIEALQKQVDAQKQRILELESELNGLKAPLAENTNEDDTEATEDESTLGSQ
jgi:peptidoglycan hydrolase CwlO-like protein